MRLAWKYGTLLLDYLLLSRALAECDECLVLLDTKLQGYLLCQRRFRVAKCSTQYGLAQTQRRRLHSSEASSSCNFPPVDLWQS
jgi:hypothetical protein